MSTQDNVQDSDLPVLLTDRVIWSLLDHMGTDSGRCDAFRARLGAQRDAFWSAYEAAQTAEEIAFCDLVAAEGKGDMAALTAAFNTARRRLRIMDARWNAHVCDKDY